MDKIDRLMVKINPIRTWQRLVFVDWEAENQWRMICQTRDGKPMGEVVQVESLHRTKEEAIAAAEQVEADGNIENIVFLIDDIGERLMLNGKAQTD